MAYQGGSGHYRRSLQDVDALGLFHHGRGIGRHVGNLDDARRSDRLGSADDQRSIGLCRISHVSGCGLMNDVIFLFSGQEEHGLPAAHPPEQGGRLDRRGRPDSASETDETR